MELFLISLVDILISLVYIFFLDPRLMDFASYYAQAEDFLDGERDFSNLNGFNGPAYYPAGNIYLYALLSLTKINYNLLYS
jgi:hypothetical protein